MTTQATPTAGPCPTDADLAALTEARLDPAAREHLLRHLDACDACRRIVAALGRAEASTRIAPLPDSASEGPEAAADDPPSGTVIGRFELVRVLGSGGMGIVFEAHDPELDRRVALKLMRSSVGSSAAESRARQLREARALARFSHPHVVEVFDVGIWNARVWIAMELVVGQTLREWAQQRRPTWREAFAVLLDAARGLAAVHAAGLVHRDFKPSNVLIDAAGRVRVADFGLVSATVDAGLPSLDAGNAVLDPSATPTLTAAIVGTPAYMAPEQHRGRSIDARADQFAFCVTAYEILYGRRPFEASTMAAMLASMVAGDVARPSRTEVPRAVHRVLVRGLAFAPADRWPDMQALSAEASRAARRRPGAKWMLLGASAIVVGLVVASGGSSTPCVDAGAAMTEAWYGSRERVQQAFARADRRPAYGPIEAALDRYAGDWVRASRHACTALADHASREQADACLHERRTALAALVDVLASGSTRTLARGLEATRSLPTVDACIDPSRASAVPVRTWDRATEDARAKLASSAAHLWTGDADTARALAVAVLADADATADPRIVASALHARGTADRHRHRLDDAEATLTEAFLAARAADDAELALRTGLELATLVGDQRGRTAEGLQWIDHALQASPVELRERPRWAALAEDSRGLVLRRKGELEAALEHLTAAVSIAEGSDDVVPLNHAFYLSHAATTHSMLGDTESARLLLEEALAIIDEHAGPDHPQLGLERMNLGSVLFAEGRYAAARQTWTEALQILERVHLEGDPLLAQLRANLGLAARAEGDFDAALEALARARDDMQAQFGPEHPFVAKVLGQLAELHVARNELDLAVTTANAAIASLEATGGDDDARGRSWMHLGAAQWIAGDAQAAASAFGRGVALLERQLGERHGAVAEAHARRCEALVDVDPRGEAEARCDEAVEVARAASDRDAEHHARRGRARLAVLRGEMPTLAEVEASSGAPDPFDAFARLRWAEALHETGHGARGRLEAQEAARAFEALGPRWDALRRRSTTATR